MTSVADKYYRRIIQNIDNVRIKFDISTLLVKSKEHESKINDIENDISDNLELINANKSNISDNLEKTYSIEENNLKITNNVFNDKYNIEKQ